MEIICVSNLPGSSRKLHLGAWGVVGMGVTVVLGGIAVGLLGFWLGMESAAPSYHPSLIAWEQELGQQREDLANARQDAENNLNALAQRLGELQARIIRLDALGQRLVDMAELEDGEFDFASRPAMGGPEDGTSLQSNTVPDFLTALASLDGQIEDRQQQLRVLESLLMNSRLQAAALPAGRPIKKGWISSYYGRRSDPITGKKAFHDGIDFAGRMGTEVVAVASGVVTWSGKRYGYGRLIEVNHGNGLVTRYAHNDEDLVKVGDRVEKGQVIALMGNSGRSTGPHVHFEVLKNGRHINPMKYVQAAR